MSQTTTTLKGQCIAEFLGTGLILFFGAGCVAALKLAGATFGQWEICIVWGLAVSMAVYLSAGVSGAHLNPAVTVALCLFANFEGRKVLLIFCLRWPVLSVARRWSTDFTTACLSISNKVITWYGVQLKA